MTKQPPSQYYLPYKQLQTAFSLGSRPEVDKEDHWLTIVIEKEMHARWDPRKLVKHWMILLVRWNFLEGENFIVYKKLDAWEIARS